MGHKEKKEKPTDILSAIKNLPDELITDAIWEAAIKEGKIKLLDVLPTKYLTDVYINTILEKQKDSYSWDSFSLLSIPETARTSSVCEVAVNKSIDNYIYVPVEKRTNEMLKSILVGVAKNIRLLPLVPENTWTIESVHQGIISIYGSSNSSYNSRYGSSSNKDEQMKLIQIFLDYVPENYKTKDMYFGLFSASMQTDHIEQLIPKQFKKADYYTLVAVKDITKVPADKLTYKNIWVALKSKNNQIANFFDDKKPIKPKLLSVLDDYLADIIIDKDSMYFTELPQQYQTKSRFIKAIELGESNSYGRMIYDKIKSIPFDKDVCQAIVSKNNSDCPDFPAEIWTPDFVQYCMANATNYRWFAKMPGHLQTQEIANIAVAKSMFNIEHVRPDLITFDVAVEAFRYKRNYGGYDYREYVPNHYLEGFRLQTGLPDDFFGGERVYSEVRDSRINYTYCQIGDSYVGYFEDNNYNRLIMTRRSPMQITPSIVFNRTIGTFHKTWFEKIIADSDPQFVQPVPAKGLKGKQISPYMDVCMQETINGNKIYAHSFLGNKILFTATINDKEYENTSFESLKKIATEKQPELEEA